MSRRVRYGCAAAAIVAGLACAAVLTGSVGNTVATALIAVGLIALLASLSRDLGMGVEGRHRRAAAPPPGAAPRREERSEDGPPPAT